MMIKSITRLAIFSSIRSKLITLLLILVGLPLLIAGYLSYRSATDALLKQTTQQLGNLADKTAQQIDNFFRTARKDINLLADYPFIQLAFLQYEFKQRLDTVQRLLADYGKKNDYFSHIYLINLDGSPILSVPAVDLAKHHFATDLWFLKTLQNGIHLSDAASPSENGQPGIYLGKLVFDFENPSVPVGVLAFHIKSSAYTAFARSLHIGSGGYAIVAHHGGRLIYHPDNRFQTTRDVLQKGDRRLATLIDKLTKGETGYGRYAFLGDEKFLVYTSCKEMPWSVGITVMQGELMADINRFQKKMLTFFGAIMLLILPISYLFIKGLTRPIKQLMEGANRIGSGDLDQTIHIESNDELRGVAEEFNKMALQLKASMNEIIDLKNFNEDILRNVTSGIITVDRSCRITSFNASAFKILNHEPQFVPDGSPETPPKHLVRILEALRQTLDSGLGVHHSEVELSAPGQEHVYVEINTSLLSSMTGKIFGAIAEIRDITQRKRMEEVMLRVEKLASLGELSAGMAHEIRNPLAGIKTSVQVLSKRVTKSQSKELLYGIESEINRLNNIVTDLLRFSRPAPPMPEPLDVASALDMTLDLMSEKIKTHRITVERYFDNQVPRVMVDREQIRQILLNLLLNSIKAMETGGRLTVGVRLADHDGEGLSRTKVMTDLQINQYIEVVFADTGKGIDPRHLPKVFDPFFTTDPKGTGLGLAIAHKLMEENQGFIFLDSVKDKGTQAVLLLPIAQEQGDI